VIVQVPKLVAAALAHETEGVNAKLAALEALTYFGADPTPPDVVVTEPSADDFVALATADKNTATGPVVSVLFTQIENFPPFGMVAYRDAKPVLVIRYDDASLDDASEIYRNCAHTMRAILLVLGEWLKSGDDSRLTLEGVQIIGPGDVWVGSPPELSQMANPVTFAAYCQFEVKDIAP
jgi:hypothetical protein